LQITSHSVKYPDARSGNQGAGNKIMMLHIPKLQTDLFLSKFTDHRFLQWESYIRYIFADKHRQQMHTRFNWVRGYLPKYWNYPVRLTACFSLYSQNFTFWEICQNNRIFCQRT